MGFDDREDTKSCHLPKARLDMAHRDNVNGRSWRSHRLRVTIRVLFPIKLFFPFHCTAIQRRPHAFSSHYFSCSSPKLHQGYVSMSLFRGNRQQVWFQQVCAFQRPIALVRRRRELCRESALAFLDTLEIWSRDSVLVWPYIFCVSPVYKDIHL